MAIAPVEAFKGVIGTSDASALLTLLLSLLGGFTAIGLAMSYSQLILDLFVLSGKNLKKYGAGKKSWAVITGASDGIGREFALQLAKAKFNIVLVSRTESKLHAVAEEIEGKFGVETKVLAMDFAKNEDKDYDRLQDLISTLDVGVLVNNVGQSHSIPVPFTLTPLQEMKNIININCHGTLRITQIVAPRMVERKNGLILTMGSFGGLLPTPLLATYSGSKAFLNYWNQSIAAELAPSGVDCYLIKSYLVTSAMSKIKRASMTIPSPKAFVATALGKIGLRGGAATPFTMTPYPAHAFMNWGLEWLQTATGAWGKKFVLEQNFDMHRAIRKRALKKAERDAKKQ
ncbi:NAD(P)-binding protein [Saitoella complicata NRRL Y-17804]|uniref:NAD(P)-binding protein n=1 Tax=Saitoella complicata (strain BCRC 22490 / CBS 7301 / JCM 7358 / NBRC 10748 / NRRL Y-17804) TaxID=698492 RepID=UPI00086760D1|nr:NAD(P)-binding protein [Saitoella complicata NRRL Y-17804]ODQ49866.1 NAD(P)-binding protein [Saitoella complicata NRRL Y-17804]